jgi:16S rRNA (guanine966-N2)-methyltransferase
MPEAGRVIAGSARGLRLEGAPAGTRPLSDRVKQALFASLEAEGALSDGFLDLYAGTGAAGIEALSRGAKRATFVEHESRAAALIAANLRRTRLDGGRVVRRDVVSFLADGRRSEDDPYRACLADPPYDEPVLQRTLELLGDRSRGWLTDDAVVVAKHFWREAPGERFGALRLDRERRFGETMLTFYRHNPEAA